VGKQNFECSSSPIISLKIIFTAGKEHISNHINNGKKSTEFMKNVRKWINGSIK